MIATTSLEDGAVPSVRVDVKNTLTSTPHRPTRGCSMEVSVRWVRDRSRFHPRPCWVTWFLAILLLTSTLLLDPGALGRSSSAIEHPLGGFQSRPMTRMPVSSGQVDPTLSDGSTGFPGQTFKILPENLTGAYNPSWVVYDPVNGELYVTDILQLFSSDEPYAITVVNPTSGREITQIPVNNTVVDGGLVVDPANGGVFAGIWGGYVSVVNATTNQLSFPTFLGAAADILSVMASNPVNGDILYAGEPSSSEVILVNGSDFQNLSMSWLGGIVRGAAFDPNNREVYVSAGWAESNLTVLNADNLSIISNIRHVPSGPCVFDPTNQYLYVAGIPSIQPNGSNTDAGTVTVLNTVTNHVVTKLPVGILPVGVALDPVNGYLYVSNMLSNNISVVNTQTNQVVGSFNVPPFPYDVTYDSASRSLFIPDLGGGGGVYGNANALIEVFPNYPRYTLTFEEQGLPVGANWSVSIDGQVYSAVGPASISIPEFNGSYTFVVNGSQGWTPSPTSGTVQLSGTPQAIPIRFLSPFGSIQGSIQPSDATVTLDNQSINVTSTGNFSVDSLTPGTYVVTARAPGYFGVSIAVSILPRNLTNLHIQLVPALPAATQLLQIPWVAGLVGGLAVLAGLMAAGFVVYYRRHRHTSRPPVGHRASLAHIHRLLTTGRTRFLFQ